MLERQFQECDLLILCRSPRAAPKTSSHRKKKLPVKLKITIKKEQKCIKLEGENGQQARVEEEDASEEDEVEMGDDYEDEDYSPHVPSRHGLKKVQGNL